MNSSTFFRFSPPAGLQDFSRSPALYDDWHAAVSFWFDSQISQTLKNFRPKYPKNRIQFFNPARYCLRGPTCEQTVLWNAFPKNLTLKYPSAALRIADKLVWLPVETDKLGHRLRNHVCRQQLEYCEWHVTRRRDGKIRKVAFTSEPPEYWFALFGGYIPLDDSKDDSQHGLKGGSKDASNIEFHGNPQLVLNLYRDLVSQNVKMNDLIAMHDIYSNGRLVARKGGYNPFNKWNTSEGIVHLSNPGNALRAEIRLAAFATILFRGPDRRPVVEPEQLISCVGMGGIDLNSDPTIVGTVNALARRGAMVSLTDPVGLYMHHIDLAGWKAPDGHPLDDCVKLVRGAPTMMERIEIEVPHDRKFVVGDICIGGVPIEYGGQIAECITVKLTGVAGEIASVKNALIPCIPKAGPSGQKAPALKISIT